MNSWCAVYTHLRAELKASINLAQQGFEVYLPRYLKKRKHARKVDWVPSPLFPRYLFVNASDENFRWRSICSTIGVHSLVCQGDRPSIMPANVIDSIKGHERDDGLIAFDVSTGMKSGDAVEVTDGPFADNFGIFKCRSDSDRAVILIEMLGREVSVRIPAGQIRAVA